MEETQVVDTPSDVVIDNQQLLEAVRRQVEYYFSKENLHSDAYLTSQMDAQMTVPISVVMKFAKLKALTQDESILRQALESSSITQVVGDKIKANIKPAGRSTIILREIPSDTPVEEVKEIFNFEGCKPIGAIRSEIGDSWFVAMDTEEEAKDTLFDLRLKKRTFRGQPIKARLKTETVVRSFYPLQSAPPAVPVGYPPIAFPGQIMDMRAFGYALPVSAVEGMQLSADFEAQQQQFVDSGKIDDAGKGVAKESKTDTSRSKVSSSSSSGGVKTGSNSSNHNNNSNNSKNNNNNRTKGANGQNYKKEPLIELNVASFPPLHTTEETPVPTPGYKESYVKYSFEEIISIVKEVQDAVLPEALTPANHPLALTATPNLDLLKKQRTYSIDETREQLRQGRPVHREAITSGAVDYRSLMYGDDGQQHHAGVVAAVANKQQTAVVTSQQHQQAPHSKAGKGRSNSHDVVDGATPKKISQSSWAAMVKSSAAATAADEGVKVQQQNVTKSPVKASVPSAGASASKKANVAVSGGNNKQGGGAGAGNDRRKGSKSEGNTKEGATSKVGGGDAGAKRDRKKSNVAAEGGQNKDASTSVAAADVKNENEVVVSASSDSSALDQTTTDSVKSPTVWGGKASFANVVKLKGEEGDISPVAVSPVRPAVAAAVSGTASKKASHGDAGSAAKQHKPTSSGGASKTSGGSDRSRSERSGGGAAARVSSGGKEGSSSVRRPRDSQASAGSAPGASPDSTHARKTSVPSSGANSSGVWVREVLPSLPKK